MPFEVEVCLRPKNQLTLPEAIVKRWRVEPGDRLLFLVDDGQPDEVRLRRIRHSYAGALAGVYGTPDEAAAYIRDERASWGE